LMMGLSQMKLVFSIAAHWTSMETVICQGQRSPGIAINMLVGMTMTYIS
jgi:hypothetical protein